jgi:hypothetical protein
MAAVLSGVLTGQLWTRYSEEAQVLGFNGIFERILAAQAGFGDGAQAYRAARSGLGEVQKASALEEWRAPTRGPRLIIGAALTSAVDAVDGSSTGTQVPKMWVLFEAPTIRRS